jgi:hypothetical protein
LIFQTFLNKKVLIAFYIFIIITGNKLIADTFFHGLSLKEGKYFPIVLMGNIEQKTYKKNELVYFLVLYDAIHIYTNEVCNEVSEIEIEFTEQCTIERLLKIFDPEWGGYIVDGRLFLKKSCNGHNKFMIKLDRIVING